jgi:hypothetical protein
MTWSGYLAFNRPEARLYINASPWHGRAQRSFLPPTSTTKSHALGSLDGEYFDQDRVTVTRGRMAGLDAANEFVATTQAAQLLGWHVGQVVPVGFYTGAQTNEPGFGTTKMKPTLQLDMKLVGLVVFNNEVVLDEVDRYPAFLLFTPAVTRPLSAGVQDATYGLKLRDGAQGVPAVEREIIRALPKGTTYNFHVTSVVEGQVDRTVKPEAIALGAFGAIAMLAALLIAMQVIGRQLQAGSDDLEVLRALGASRTVVMADGLLGVLGSVLLGSLLAVGVAIGLSPLSPIGPVRPVDPSAGTAIDSSVLGFGLLVLIGAIGAGAAALAYRSSSRLRQQGTTRATLGSSFARLVASSGAAAPAVAGVRFAVEPGRGRTAVPVRSALFGTVLAMVIVVATLTFGSGLNTLVSHPALYGWNWNYALASSYIVPPQARSLLADDRFVAAWSGVSFANAQIDGQIVPILLASPNAKVTPPVLSGHSLEANNQIVLGAATLAQLHKSVGDTVIASYGTPKDAPVYVPPTPLLIVGTATFTCNWGHADPSHVNGNWGHRLGRHRTTRVQGVHPQPGPNAQRSEYDLRPTKGRRPSRRGPSDIAPDSRRGKQGIRGRPEQRCRRSERRSPAGPVPG